MSNLLTTKYSLKIKEKKKLLKNEMEALSLQLENVEKRISRLKFNTIFYFGAIAGIYLLSELFIIIGQFGVILNLICTVCYGILSLFGPFFFIILSFLGVINLIILWENRDSDDLSVSLPFIRDPMLRRENSPEKNYITEKRKLLLVLNKYNFYYDECTNLEKLINENSIFLNTAEIDQKLDQMHLYEYIRPSTEYNSQVFTRAKNLVHIILVVILAVILIGLYKGLF